MNTTFFIALLLLLACIIKLSTQVNSSLMILVTIEMLSISLILMVTKNLFFLHNSITSSVFIMIIVVIEATLGLTVLINMSRQTSHSSSLSAHLTA
uniref:NADH dehydrogenase subunit 4L n=1 Tax=Gordius sp. VVA-2019 TaxID=2586752 RepID=A0A514ABU3_9BILA|nr:NADH dehydrogenase subunit 4L [Gordius sp. VVA-2019]